jgi:hypothetical protein
MLGRKFGVSHLPRKDKDYDVIRLLNLPRRMRQDAYLSEGTNDALYVR